MFGEIDVGVNLQGHVAARAPTLWAANLHHDSGSPAWLSPWLLWVGGMRCVSPNLIRMNDNYKLVILNFCQVWPNFAKFHLNQLNRNVKLVILSFCQVLPSSPSRRTLFLSNFKLDEIQKLVKVYSTVVMFQIPLHREHKYANRTWIKFLSKI